MVEMRRESERTEPEETLEVAAAAAVVVPELDHAPGDLVSHDHARLAATAFPREAVHVAAADADGFWFEEDFAGTGRRSREIDECHFPGAVVA